jgi:hypothetical protein
MVAQASWQALRVSPAEREDNPSAFAAWQSFGFGCYISTHPLKVTVAWNFAEVGLLCHRVFDRAMERRPLRPSTA